MNFAEKTGLKIIFGVNALYGRHEANGKNWTGEWNSTNAVELITEWSQDPYKQSLFGLEYGNELCGERGSEAHFDATGYAKDTIRFINIVKNIYELDTDHMPKILGADCNLNTG